MSLDSASPTAILRTARERLDAVAEKIGTGMPTAFLRAVLRGESGSDRAAADAAITERLDRMEHRVLLLGDAVAVLARGLEQCRAVTSMTNAGLTRPNTPTAFSSPSTSPPRPHRSRRVDSVLSPAAE
ncbi:hypothetical protein [Nocardia asiatica]|uniref:hypothetical protein n=1 Tax=Nocardia asiatica TaxID=209252 RepID=UPI002457580C|nr:hypothetical protein [Nocardia asiatica]